MHGFEWKDQRGIEGTGFVRALRSLLTSHLPDVLPRLDTAIADQIEQELAKSKIVKSERALRKLIESHADHFVSYKIPTVSLYSRYPRSL